MIESLIIAVIVVAVIFAIAHIIVTCALPGRAAAFGWLVYLIAALIAVLVLWRVIAPLVGPLP